jgi:cytochrome P450
MPKLDEIPAHVPPELVVDVDVYALPAGDIDAQLGWRKFAEYADKGPLIYSPYNGGHWVATVPEDIVRFQRDNTNFGNTVMTVPDRPGPRLVPLESDPPNHAHYRRNVLPIFAAGRLKELEPGIRELTVELVEDLRPKGGCDFISDFALKLPVIVFLQIMGLPLEDGKHLNSLVDTFARHPEVAKKMQALGEMSAYVDQAVQNRLSDPRDDAITRITKAQIHDRPYTHDEMLSTLTLLALGGLDSVAMHISFITLYLARNPDQRAYVRDHLDDLGHIVAEFARRFPIAQMMRQVLNDYEHGGVTMKKGDMVAIPAALYNFDDAIFDHSADVDFSRPGGKLHLTFGTGPHACPGSGLARLEVEIFLQEWLTRIPDFQVDPGVPVKCRSAITNAVDQLSLTWPTA